VRRNEKWGCGSSASSVAWLFAFCSPASAANVAVRSVEVEKTAFRVTLNDGRVLKQEQLRGAILVLGDGTGAQRRIRIDGIERDAKDPAGEIILYALSEQNPEGEWHNLCLPDIEGRRLGFPLAGATIGLCMLRRPRIRWF
jgi:hypothetical protein